MTQDCPAAADDGWWWERFERELERDPAAPAAGPPSAYAGGERRVIVARRGSAVARIAELLSSGSRVLVVSSDAGRRAALGASVDIGGGGRPATVCMRCEPGLLLARADDRACSLLLTDWATLAAAPEAAAAFDHAVAVDPPASPDQAALVRGGPGFLHEIWGSGEDLAEPCWDAEWALRAPLAEIYRALAPVGRAEGAVARDLLAGPGRFPRTPEGAARCARILGEIGVAELGGGGDARWIGVVSSERTELERSGAWRACESIHLEGRRYLQSRRAER